MGETLHEGWVILTFGDGRPAQAGQLRYEHVKGPWYQWVLTVPACHHHKEVEAIIDPAYVRSVTPCTRDEAVTFAGAPVALRKPPAA